MADSAGIPNVDLGAALHALGLPEARLVSSDMRASDTRVWRVELHGQDLAIRVFRPDQQSVMRAEIQAMELALSHEIPIPRPIATGVIEDSYPAMAIEWVQGEPVGDSIVADPDSAQQFGLLSGQLLARVHEIPIPTRTDPDHLTENWVKRAVGDDRQLQAVLDAVRDPELRLLHLDYHPFNLLVLDGAITGIIDWTNAALGDPRADIARSSSTMELLAPMYVGEVPERIAACHRFTRGLLEGYESLRGQLRDMAPFHAWAGNMILTDLRPRVQSLPTSDPHGFILGVETWTEHWRQQAIGSPDR